MSTTDEAAIFVQKNDGTKASKSCAFHAWKYLVNKYIELTSEVSKERIEHLMKPLQAFNSQTSDMCTIKFKIWWDLIVALETHIEKLSEISKENENLVNTCLNPILETVLSKNNGLSEEILTSEDYYCGPGDPRTPLYTMLDILLSPSFVGIKSHKHEALFMTLLDRLFELGIGPEGSTITFVQEVIKKLDVVLNLGISIRPNILRTTWNIIAKKLTVYMNLGHNINQGNDNEVDFKCIYLMLIFPVNNIDLFVFEHESIFKSWRELFNALLKNCRLYSVVENDVYDDIFRQLLQEVAKMNDMDYDELFFVTNLVTTVLERIPFEMVNKQHSSCIALTHPACVHQSLKLLHLLSSKTTNLTGNDIYFKIMSLFAKCSVIFCKNLQVWVPKDFVLSLEDFINFLLNVNINHSEALQYYVKIIRNMWNCFLNNFVKQVLCNNFDKIEIISILQNIFESSFVFPDHEIHIISMKFLLSENWYLNLEVNKCMLCGDSFKSYKEIKSIVCNEKYNQKEVDERKEYLIQKVQNFFLDREEVANSHESNDSEMEHIEILPCEREREQVEILSCERDNVSSRTLPEQAYSSDSTSEVYIGSVESSTGTAIYEEIFEDIQEVTDMRIVGNVNSSGMSSPEFCSATHSVADRARGPIPEERRSIKNMKHKNDSTNQRNNNCDTLTVIPDNSNRITGNILNTNMAGKHSSQNLISSSPSFINDQSMSEEKRINADTQQNNTSMIHCETSDLLIVSTGYSSDITENIVNEENAKSKHSHTNETTSEFTLIDAQSVLEKKKAFLDSQQDNQFTSQYNNTDLLTAITDYSNEITENILNNRNAEKNHSCENLTTSLLPVSDAQDKRTHTDTQENNRPVIQCAKDLLTVLTDYSNESTENIVNKENAEMENSHDNLTTSLLIHSDAQDKRTNVDSQQSNKSMVLHKEGKANRNQLHENLTASLLPFTDARKPCYSLEPTSKEKWTNPSAKNNDSSIVQVDNNSDSLIEVSDSSEGITHSQCNLTTFSFPGKHITDQRGRNVISNNEVNQCPFAKEANAKCNETGKELIQVADVNKQYFNVTSEREQFKLDKGSDGRSEKYTNNYQKKKKKKNKHKKYEKRKQKSLQQKLMDTTHSTNSVSLKCSRKAPIIIRIARIKENDENVERYYIKNLNGAENTEQQALTEDGSTSSVDIEESNETQSEENLSSASNFEININDLVEKNMGCALTEVDKSLLEYEISNNNEIMNETNGTEGNFEIAKNKKSMGDKDLTLSNAFSSLTEVLSSNDEKPVDAKSPQVSGKFSVEHEQINTCFKNGEDNIPREASKSLTKFPEHGNEETFDILNCPEENVTSISNQKIVDNEDYVINGFQNSFREFIERNNTSCIPQNNINIVGEIQDNKYFILTETPMTLMKFHKRESENRLNTKRDVENEKISLEEEKMSSKTHSSLMECQSSINKKMKDMRSSSENVQMSTVHESNSHGNKEHCKTHTLLPEFQESNSEKTQKNGSSSKANLSTDQTEDGENSSMYEAFQPESIGEKTLNDSRKNNHGTEEKITDSKDCVGTSASLMKSQESVLNNPPENISTDDEKNQPCAKFMSMFKECSDFTSRNHQKKSNFYHSLKIGKSLIDYNVLNTESLQKAVQNFLPTIIECKSSLLSQHSPEFKNGFESKSIINEKTILKKIYPQVLENESIEFPLSDQCLGKSTIMIQPSKVENKFDLKNYDNNAINRSKNRNIFTLNIDDHPIIQSNIVDNSIETVIQKNSEKTLKNSHECNALSLKYDGKIENVVTQAIQREQSSQECNFPFDKVKEFSIKCSLSSFKDTLKLFGEREGLFNLPTGSLNIDHQGKVSEGLENPSSVTESASSSRSTSCVSLSSKSFDPEHAQSNNFSSMLQYFLQRLSQLFDGKTIIPIQDNSALVSSNIPHVLINKNDNSGMNITLSHYEEGNQILVKLEIKNDHNDDNNIIMIQKCELPEGLLSKFSCLSSQACLNTKIDLLPSPSNGMDMESMHNIFKTLISQLFIKDSFLNDNKPSDLPSTSSASTSSFINSIPEVLVKNDSEIEIPGESESSNKKCELQESLAMEGSSYVGNTTIESLCTNLNSGNEESSSIENLKESIIGSTATMPKDENQLYGELIDNENIRCQLSSQLEPQTKIIKQLAIDENNLLPIQSPNSSLEVVGIKCINHESEIEKTDNSEIKKDCKELETNSHDTSLYNVRICCTRKRSSSCSLLANDGKAVTRKLRKRNTERNIFTRRCTLECCSWIDKREDITKKPTYVKNSKINFVKALLSSKRRILNPKLCKPNRHNAKDLNVCSLVNANEMYSLVRENKTSEEKRTRILTKKKTCCFLCDHPKTSVCNTVEFSVPGKNSFCKNLNYKKEDSITSNKGKTLQTTKDELTNVQGTRKISAKMRRTKGDKAKQIMIYALDASLQANTNKGSRIENKMTCINLHSKKRKCKAMLQDSTSFEFEQTLINEPGTFLRRQKTNDNSCRNFDYSKKLKREMITNSIPASTQSVPSLLDISRPRLIDYCTRKRKSRDTELKENCAIKVCRLELKPGCCLQGKEESYIVTEMTSSLSVKVTKSDGGINLNSEPVQNHESASNAHANEILKKNVNDVIIPANNSAIKEENVLSQLTLRGKKNDVSSSIANPEEGFKTWDHSDQSEIEWKHISNLKNKVRFEDPEFISTLCVMHPRMRLIPQKIFSSSQALLSDQQQLTYNPNGTKC
ncbi:Protein of unknown function [Gryllus bimaculatus]|nr:Protein of unknown function [Gryllus bimaculatus]